MLQVVFRSVNKLLMDTSTSEYLFCLDFFQDESVYHELIAPTLTVVEGSLTAQVQVRWFAASCSQCLCQLSMDWHKSRNLSFPGVLCLPGNRMMPPYHSSVFNVRVRTSCKCF